MPPASAPQFWEPRGSGPGAPWGRQKQPTQRWPGPAWKCGGGDGPPKCTQTEAKVLVPRASLSQPQPRPLGKRRRVASTKEDKEAVVVEKGGGSGWRKALGLHVTAAQGLRPL